MLQRIKNAVWAFRQGANLSPQDWERLISIGEFGEESSSGVRVSEGTAIRHATVFACVNILARDMSALPLKLYERKGDGGRTEVENHPVSEWLRRPNGLQTPMQWRMRGWTSVLSSGNQYEQVVRNGLDEIQTVPIDSTRIEQVVIGPNLTKRYKYRDADGRERFFRDDQVLHNFGLSLDGGITGVSPVRLCMETVGRAIAVGEYGAAYFRSPQPKTVIKGPGFKTQQDKDTFVSQWTERFAGKKGLSTVAVLPPGLEIDQILKIPNNEAQFIETQKFSKEEIAQIYMVPMHRLQALDRATFSNIEHQALEYVQYALLPWLTAFEQSVERAFLTAEEQQRYFVRHNVDGLLRGDFKTRMEGSSMAIQWSMATPNERRALENLPAIKGGDDLLVPLNMVRLKDLAAPEPPADPVEPDAEPQEDEDEDDERQIALNRAAGIGEAELRSAQGRRLMIRRMVPRVEAALQREVEVIGRTVRGEGVPMLRSEKRDTLLFIDWLSRFVQGRSDAVRAAVRPLFMTLASEIAEQANAEVRAEVDEAQIELYTDGWASNYAKAFTASTIAQLRAVALEAQTQGADAAEAVSERTHEWEQGASGDPRAAQEARDEAFGLGNAIAGLVFSSVGLGRAWATFGKNCPYCESLRGKKVAAWGGSFFGPGEFQPEGAPHPLKVKRGVKHPPAHKGCDCMVVPG